MEKLSTSQPSPLSPTLWPTKAFSAKGIALFLGALVSAGIVAIALARIAVVLDGVSPFTHGDLRLTRGLIVGQFLAYLPILLVALPLLPRIAHRSLAQLGLRAPRWSDIGAAVLGYFGMLAATAIASIAQDKFLHVTGKEQAVAAFSAAHDPVLIATFVIAGAIVAPFVEEFIFRVFFLNAFLRYLPGGVAIALDGLLFGAGHGDKNAFIPLAFGGAVLAFVYYRTGSLVAAMLTHALFNSSTFVALLFFSGKGM